VLLLGDSFTFGQGVNYADAWPALAERMLERQRPGAFDLVKAGMQGLDTRSELILLHRLAGRYRPDAVVLGFLINDVYTNVPLDPSTLELDDGSRPSWDSVRHTVFNRADEQPTFHLLTFARRLVTSSDRAYVGLYLSAPARGDFLRSPLPALPRRQLEVTTDLLTQMAAFCDSLGVPLVVLSIPQQFQVLYLRGERRDSSVDVRVYDRVLASVGAERGFGWVSTLDALQRADTGGVELFFRHDGHLTPAGNAVVAEEFVERVIPRLIPSANTRGDAALSQSP
jgi:hypothetical protein